MPILISAKEVQKSFGVRPLFEGVTFVLESGDRIGLIGPNGAGKSTLLRLLSSEILPDKGEVTSTKGLRVGYLQQTPELPSDKTVEEVVSSHVDSHDWEAMARVKETISKLGLRASDNVGKLSGGWQKRVALARELVLDPDLLLLDEPTNHLDMESIVWLENFLAGARFATLTVTHDRVFLQKICNRILELDRRNPGGLLDVRGNYADYVYRKENLLLAQKAQESALRNKLRRETEWLRQGAKARTTKQQARIARAGDLQEQVSELEYRNVKKTVQLDFQGSQRQPKRLVEAKAISKAYGDRVLFKNLNLFIGPGSRVGLLGPNGCGKSTLIRALVGTDTADSGTILRADTLKVSYFEQHRDTLDPNTTVWKAVCPSGDQVVYRGNLIHIRGYLDRFLFRPEQVEMPVGRLSGGEQSRLRIAQLMLKEANLLILDEPTNDLDMETLDVLQDCLEEFDGAVLIVTHDRYFLDQVADEILAFDSRPGHLGTTHSFAGLAQWETWFKEANRPEKVEKAVVSEGPSKKRKLSYNETRELSSMEAKIAKLEEKISMLNTEITVPEIQSNSKRLNELFTELASLQKELETLYDRWHELETLKDSLSD